MDGHSRQSNNVKLYLHNFWPPFLIMFYTAQSNQPQLPVSISLTPLSPRPSLDGETSPTEAIGTWGPVSVLDSGMPGRAVSPPTPLATILPMMMAAQGRRASLQSPSLHLLMTPPGQRRRGCSGRLLVHPQRARWAVVERGRSV